MKGSVRDAKNARKNRASHAKSQQDADETVSAWRVTMSSEEERKKREIFEGMSPRRQQRILKKGYDKWDPFLAPKEPPFYRTDSGKSPPKEAELFSRFMQSLRDAGGQPDPPPPAYVQGAREICTGLVRGEDRYRGMRDFCCWLRDVGEDLDPER
jgi:hypothetical protein